MLETRLQFPVVKLVSGADPLRDLVDRVRRRRRKELPAVRTRSHAGKYAELLAVFKRVAAFRKARDVEKRAQDAAKAAG